MTKVLAGAAGLLVALLVLAVVTVSVATAAWRRGTAAFRDALEAGACDPVRELAREAFLDELDRVPPVVRRYLSRSIPGGSGLLGVATLHQEGSFQMSRGEEGWRPFTATQTVRAYPPGFVWDASIRAAPLLAARVRDGYVGGRGTMKAALAGVVTVVEGAPGPDLDEGALYRYLAEAVWMPTRLLPGAGLSWTAVDDHTAVATLQDGDLSVAVHFSFDDHGDVVGIYAPSRGREVDGEYVPTPWRGRFTDHADVQGFRIPREGEVAWLVDGEEVPYWRGRVTAAVYELCR